MVQALLPHIAARQARRAGSDLPGAPERGPKARRSAWALTRIEGAAARQAVHDALKDQDDTVRHAAIHSAGVWRDAGALPHLLDALSGPSPQLQRAAAEALGRIGDKSAV